MGSALGIVTGKGKGSVMVTAVFLALGALFMYADRTVLYPMLEVIAADFSLSGKATGFITSTYFFYMLRCRCRQDLGRSSVSRKY